MSTSKLVAQSPDPFEACAVCGQRFEREQSYPARVDESDDGGLEVYSFCSDDCLAEWQD